MKILRTIESFYPFMSGPANQAFMISKNLGKNKIESPIFTTDYKAKSKPSEEVYKGIRVKRFKIKKSYMKYFYTPDLSGEIISYKPDLIHAHNYRSYQTEIAYKSAKKLNIPFIINTHGGLIGYKTITKGIKKVPYWVYDKARGVKLIDDADAVIVSSRQEYEEALAFGVAKVKLHIIPMGIDIKEYESVKRTKKDDKLVLLFIGRIGRDRNVMPIIKAMESLNNKDIELRIVGGAEKRSDTEKPGYLKELKDYSKKKVLNVIFTGPKYNNELKKEYRNADIFVYTSLWENFGQTLLEAGAAGLPIISTPVGIANDLIIDDKTGYLVDFHDEKNIAEKIRLLQDRKKRLLFGKNLKQNIQVNFDWKKIMMQYNKVYLIPKR